MKLNEKLIKLRKEHGLSQEDFGNAIYVSRQAVSKWESEQTKPDIDKIKEIAKYFNVSFDYLLNDEINEISELKNENNIEENKTPKKKKHTLLKIILIILLIYFLFFLYKFIVLFRYYKIADSFSEENYWMIYETKQSGETIFEHSTTKIGNIIINESTNSFAGEDALTNENGEVIPYDIEYIDQNKDICYKLTHLDDIDAFQYYDKRQNALNEEEWNQIMCRDINLIKDNTLDLIPSNFKEIFIFSIHPFCQVSLSRNEIYINHFNKSKIRILLNNDCLVERYTFQTEFDGDIDMTFSYDYVPGHFTDKKVQNPIEKYNLQVINYPY